LNKKLHIVKHKPSNLHSE